MRKENYGERKKKCVTQRSKKGTVDRVCKAGIPHSEVVSRYHRDCSLDVKFLVSCPPPAKVGVFCEH